MDKRLKHEVTISELGEPVAKVGVRARLAANLAESRGTMGGRRLQLRQVGSHSSVSSLKPGLKALVCHNNSSNRSSNSNAVDDDLKCLTMILLYYL